MEEYQIVRSMNFREMYPMFKEEGLEMGDITEDGPEGLIQCYEVIDNKTRQRIGGGSLVFKDHFYVIKTLAIKGIYQGKGIGSKLVNIILNDIKERGGKEVYLSAKVPRFYEKLGFWIVPPDKAPQISTCHLCERYHNGCTTEIMLKELS